MAELAQASLQDAEDNLAKQRAAGTAIAEKLRLAQSEAEAAKGKVRTKGSHPSGCSRP